MAQTAYGEAGAWDSGLPRRQEAARNDESALNLRHLRIKNRIIHAPP
jgi:hypothetical protein